ncbi:hypothetical protein TWF718_006620 [Orbilia javanica]|uniref:Uncharacterized protein n=1 Tax=Orbilia javanica TaxID=47235 RepID=A0AAN8NUM2_9PEZI
MPSSISSLSTIYSNSSKATVSSTTSDIEHLTPILPYLKLSKSQKVELAISKNLSKNWEIANDGAIIMALRKERMERRKEEERERWLEAYRRDNSAEEEEIKEEGEGEGGEAGKEGPFVPCWEMEARMDKKTLAAGWLSKIMDKGRGTGID